MSKPIQRKIKVLNILMASEMVIGWMITAVMELDTDGRVQKPALMLDTESIHT